MSGYTPLYPPTPPYTRLLPPTELGHLLSCEDALLASLLAALPRPPPLARLPPAALRLLLRGPLVCHTGLEPQASRQGPEQLCYSLA